jgi:hypothetical protein
MSEMAGSMMARDTKRGAKTEVLSMRMDPKTRFVVEFLARVRGQSISTVVERAIQEAADNTTIRIDGSNSYYNTWKDYWHVSEGIRFLMVASDKNLYSTFDEEYKVSFAKTHWPFFYVSSQCDQYIEWSIEVLWPRIDEFVDLWTRTKTTDYFAAGKAMREAISQAGLQAPDWPAETSGSGKRAINDLDDDIPF